MRDVFERAETAAREDGTDITADHLVRGVLRATDPSGANVLHQLGIGETDLPRGKASGGRAARPRWGGGLQPVIQAAAEEAWRMGSRLTRSAHVLLGIAAGGHGALPGLLAGRGITLDALRARAQEALAASPISARNEVTDGARSAPGSATRELFTVDQAADFLGVHHQTLRGYIKSGKLTAYRLAGEKVLRIKRDDLMALLEPVSVEDVGEG